MNGLRRLRALESTFEQMGEECATVTVDGEPLCDVLHRIADQLEREQTAAIEWVEEHGGLEEVRQNLVAVRMIAKKLGMEDSSAFDVSKEACRRLMPEGMEWPRFEDGEPVRFGCEFEFEGAVDVVESVTFLCAGSPRFNYGLQDSWERVHGLYVRGELIKRPAPKVLDADGVEIRVGDTVYGFAGQQYEITGLCEYESSIVHAKTVGDGVAADELLALSGQLNSAQLEASKITHRAPVLAADGKPLREGETVWDVDGCGPLIVWRLPDKPGMNVSLKKNGVH